MQWRSYSMGGGRVRVLDKQINVWSLEKARDSVWRDLRVFHAAAMSAMATAPFDQSSELAAGT
jgi:hypothetical protein